MLNEKVTFTSSNLMKVGELRAFVERISDLPDEETMLVNYDAGNALEAPLVQIIADLSPSA
jgi:hypothetical protein